MQRHLLIITIVIVFFVVSILVAGIVIGIYFLRGETFRDHLIERCRSYREHIFPSLKSKIICEHYADVFDAALREDGAACKRGIFNSFFNLTIIPAMYFSRNATLWSGREAGNRIAKYFDEGKPYLPLNRVLAGYIMSEESVCNGSLWKKYKGCQHCEPKKAKENYWKPASARFALLAEGRVNILLESNYTPIVRNESILMAVEVPALQPQKVTGIDVYVYHNCNDIGKDQCEESSVRTLLATLKARKLRTICKSCSGLPK